MEGGREGQQVEGETAGGTDRGKKGGRKIRIGGMEGGSKRRRADERRDDRRYG